MKTAASILLLALLTGCAGVQLPNLTGTGTSTSPLAPISLGSNPLAQMTLADAQSALALATASGDAAGVQCLTEVVKDLQAIGSVQVGAGVLTLGEQIRVSKVQAAKMGAACPGIISSSILP